MQVQVLLPTGPQVEPPAGLAAAIGLAAVDRFLPRGAEHEERTKLLLEFCGAGRRLTGLLFRGTLAGYDFRSVTFERCRFERVTWVNCDLSETTVLRECQLTGGMLVRSPGMGVASLVDCRHDEEAIALIRESQIETGQRGYSRDDLERDFHAALVKFLAKGGIGLRHRA